MADIFLSYAREDRKKVEKLTKALELQGWSVFCDREIPPGVEWDVHIGNTLEQAGCVVVAWSRAAVDSAWVREEARFGRVKKRLVPVLLENVELPFGFGSIQAVDLSGWVGGNDEAAFRRLTEGLQLVLGTAQAETPGEMRSETPSPSRLSEPAAVDETDADDPARSAKAREVAKALRRVEPPAPPMTETARLFHARRQRDRNTAPSIRVGEIHVFRTAVAKGLNAAFERENLLDYDPALIIFGWLDYGKVVTKVWSWDATLLSVAEDLISANEHIGCDLKDIHVRDGGPLPLAITQPRFFRDDFE